MVFPLIRRFPSQLLSRGFALSNASVRCFSKNANDSKSDDKKTDLQDLDDKRRVKNKASPSVECVYVGSMFVKDLHKHVAKALEKNGDGDIQVEELKIEKNDGAMVLSEEMLEKVPEMEYLYTESHFTGQIFSHPNSRLKWAQLTMAGVDMFFDEIKKSKTKKTPDLILTRRNDGFPAMISEYVVGHIIAKERNFPLCYEQHRNTIFDKSVLEFYRQLDTLTVGVLGLGEIGSRVARYCKAMNMNVIGVVRDERYSTSGADTYQHVDQIRPVSQLSSVLESCDYLVNILPSSPHTINLLSGDVLQSCRHKKTVFINVGRGSVIDDDSLINAINKGWLGGAILDVFNKEPLPPSSPIWTLPGVHITPHVSATQKQFESPIVDQATHCFIYNLNAYRDGKPMKNLVDFDKGY